jgi:hypothetical protein
MPDTSRVGLSVYHPVVVTCDPRSTHPMVTRRATGVTKPVGRLQLSIAAASWTLSPVSSSVHSMLADSHWCRTIEEYEAVLSNNT